MIKRLEAVQYVGQAGGGKTDPAIVVAECPNGDAIEIVLKNASACERGGTALAAEIIAACLAGQLGLPVQEPFVVDLSDLWKSSLPATVRHRYAADSVCFGSRLLSGQWPSWCITDRLTDRTAQRAAAVFAFDAMIENHDRREGNSNCLVQGDEIRIIDHDLAWVSLLFRPRPWMLGSLLALGADGNHIFHRELKSRAYDRSAIEKAWLDLHDDDIAAYGAAVPAEWRHGDAVDGILTRIREVRDNVVGCLNEVERVLA